MWGGPLADSPCHNHEDAQTCSPADMNKSFDK